MTTMTRIPVLDLGPQVDDFEREVAEYLGVKHAVGVHSGSGALVIALRSLGIGQGDEVITTPFTDFATAESISQVGATPVFVDVDPVTMNLDAALVEAAATFRTRAVLPVHLFGRPCDMAAVLEVANRLGIWVVEDCAQSFGARFMVGSEQGGSSNYKRLRGELSGRYTGALGDVGCFNFSPAKNLGAMGDGGLLVTNDDGVAEKARLFRVHGSQPGFPGGILGYNSRLDELQAAILRVKFPHREEWIRGRRLVAAAYGRVLGHRVGVSVPRVVQGHVFHQYTIRLRADQRDRIQIMLAQSGIDTKVFYPIPCHRLPIYQESHAQVTCPQAERISGEVLSLPIWPEMGEDAAEWVAKTLLSLLECPS